MCYITRPCVISGDCFSGEIADDRSRQLQLIDLFVGASANNKEFKGLEVIAEARVPIVRFFHNTTNFKCDMQFRSGLAVFSSKLVKYADCNIIVYHT